jgi:CheY-like chemotaxis protein
VESFGVLVKASNTGHPTILLVHENREFRDDLTRGLQQEGYLFLDAVNAAEAVGIVIRHSRRIHLLLADDSDDNRLMAARLKPYRPDMHFIHIGSNLELSSALMEVSKPMEASQVLDSPAHRFEDEEQSQGNVREALTAKVDASRGRY